MTQKNDLMHETAQRELVLTRTVNAPRDVVFKAWTDAKHLAQWWGPKCFSNPVCKLDARPGGALYIEMQGPDGTRFPIGGTVRELVVPERFVFTTRGFDDASGIPQMEVLNTVTFEDVKGKTKITINVVILKSTPAVAQALQGMEEGWKQSLERFAVLVAGMQSPLVFERTFNAPVEKVWKAITDKWDMKTWYFDLAEFRPEVGFEFQFLGGEEGKKQYLHHCKITEVIPKQKLTYSWRYDGYDGLSYVTFELWDDNGRTKLKLTHEGVDTFPSDDPSFAKENFSQGWTFIVHTSLKNFLEPQAV